MQKNINPALCVFAAALALPLMSCGTGEGPGGELQVIDAHSHLNGKMPGGSADYDGAVKSALERMDKLGIAKTIVMPPPMPDNFPGQYECEDLLPALEKHPGRFAFLGGGGSLNMMIQKSVRLGRTTDSVKKEFRARAEKIAAAGAVGFGEFTAEHLSMAPRHPYEAAPPDHPLFLLLADIAAAKDLAMDFHMEALEKDLPVPAKYRNRRNPEKLRGNLAAFERLLAHNRGARIIWAHAGWDNTGQRTPALCRRLLESHSNLYMSIKLEEISLQATSPLEKGRLKPEWLELFRAFPDRFVLGTDQFYTSPRVPFSWAGRGQWVKVLLRQLPADLAQKIARDNVFRVFPLARKDLQEPAL